MFNSMTASLKQCLKSVIFLCDVLFDDCILKKVPHVDGNRRAGDMEEVL